jgi:hypothetical protein
MSSRLESERTGLFTHFILGERNVESVFVINAVSRQLDVKSEMARFRHVKLMLSFAKKGYLYVRSRLFIVPVYMG